MNVRCWLGADIKRESAELPLLTLSGHSVEYAVQQVDSENQGFATPSSDHCCPGATSTGNQLLLGPLLPLRHRQGFASATCSGHTITRLPFWIWKATPSMGLWPGAGPVKFVRTAPDLADRRAPAQGETAWPSKPSVRACALASVTARVFRSDAAARAPGIHARGRADAPVTPPARARSMPPSIAQRQRTPPAVAETGGSLRSGLPAHDQWPGAAHEEAL